MGTIDWSKIKNGAKGFEDLAREYIKDVFNFPKGKWKKTPNTHDGNKDAYTIIIGFHPALHENEVWWMEAKYSNESTYLSRFKLDATIVSSIFNRYVKKIIFVTNIDIKAKVISDIRTALYMGTSCKEVHFCTQNALEYWLRIHPSIYEKFFELPLTEASIIPDLFISEDISIYSVSNIMRDTEELYNVITNRIYEAHFKVISTCNQIIKISSAQKGIKRISESKKDLQNGENSLVIKFLIENNFFKYKKRTYDGIEENNLVFFKINKKIPVILKYPLNIVKNCENQLDISSQKHFQKDFFDYKNTLEASYWFVGGNSGCGKTTVVQRCVEQKKSKSGNYRYVKFVPNSINNNMEIINTFFYIFFPYMYVEDITLEYLETFDIDIKLKNNLKYLISNKEDEGALYSYITSLKENNVSFFPDTIVINPKILVFDDLQQLNKESFENLLYILTETQKLPITYILIGQSFLLEQFDFKKINLIFRNYQFELTTEDVIYNIQHIFSFTFDIGDSLIQYFFPNIVIFNIYIIFVTEIKEVIKDIDDFIFTYRNFKRNYISNEFINRQFNSIQKKSPKAWKLCENIYSSLIGIEPSVNDIQEIGILLQAGLIKYTENNLLIPFHEIYYKHFKKLNHNSYCTDNPLDKLYFSIESCKFPIYLEQYYFKIHAMRIKEEFQSVNYILEGIFESPLKNEYCRIWGDELYYLLYYEYAYSAINCNYNITGYEYLYTIYNGIKGSSSNRLNLLFLDIIYELINCDYNQGNYSKCKEYYEEFQHHFNILIQKGIISETKNENLHYVLGKNYMLLIELEKESDNILKEVENQKKFLKENYFHHYIDFCMQCSKVFCTQNLKIAYKWIEEAFKALNVTNEPLSKQALKVSFKFYFIQYLNNIDSINSLNRMYAQMQLSKEKIYSSYRHQVFIYCALLYIIGSVDEADNYFFKDISNTREIRPKMKGHYYQLLSLHYLKHINLSEAINAMTQSMKMFSEMNSYLFLSKHNYELLQNIEIDKIQYNFYLSGQLNPNTFYIDPRI